MHRVFIAAGLVSCILGAQVASAQPGLAPPGPAAGPGAEAPPQELSYRRSIAISDGVAVGLNVAAFGLALACFEATFEIFSDDKPDSHPTCPMAVASWAGGAVTYALVPAVIHMKNDNPSAAAKSVGARLGLPLAGGLAGWLVGNGSDIQDDLAAVGALTGLVTAVVVDWQVLARKPGQREPTVAVVPTVIPMRGGGGLGIGGQF